LIALKKAASQTQTPTSSGPPFGP